MDATAIIEGYEGARRVEEEVALRVAADCAGALARLDGGSRSALYVERNGPLVLTVAGGPDRFQVNVWDRDEDQGHEARDPEVDAAAEARLVLGGQGAVLPMSETLGREAALDVILAFAEDGSRAGSVAWEVNG